MSVLGILRSPGAFLLTVTLTYVALASPLPGKAAPKPEAERAAHEHEAPEPHEEPATQAEPAAHAEGERTPASPSPSTHALAKSEAVQLSQRVNCERLETRTGDELWNRAECYWRIGRLDLAVVSLRQATAKNPRDLEAYFATSWMVWESGRSQVGQAEERINGEALEELQKARVANPSHWEVDTEIGDHYFLRTDEPEKAYPEYLKARRNYGGDYARNVPRAVL